MKFKKVISRIIVFLFVACCTANGAESSKLWKVKTYEKTINGKKVNYFSVDNGTLYTDFAENSAWTFRTLKYNNVTLINDKQGAWNGTVCNVNKESQPGWSGSGHGDEQLISLKIIADGKTHDFASDLKITGKEIRVIKKSKMQSLEHTAEIVFPADVNYFVEKYYYKATEDLRGKFNFMYAFMFCNAKNVCDWLAQIDIDGKNEEEGVADMTNPSMPFNDSSIPVTLKKDIKSIAFFNKNNKTGLLYIYPEVYAGFKGFSNSIFDRPHDVKFYFRPAIDPSSSAGSQFFYEVKIVPFTASPDKWKDTVRALRNDNKFPDAMAISTK